MADTAMKRLKNYFDILKTEFGEPIDLNKSDAKYNYYSDKKTKGVESDFIRIYKLGLVVGKKASENIEYSFAFAFNKPEEPDKTLITITFKEGEKIITGSTYNMEQFKLKIKEFINAMTILKSISLNGKNIEALKTSILTVFEFNKQQSLTSILVEEALNKIDKNTTELIEKNNQYKKEVNNVSKNLESKKVEYSSYEKSKIKELGIDKLEKELGEKRKLLNQSLSEKKKELKLAQLNENLYSAKYNFDNAERSLKSKINKIISEYPNHIQKQILFEFENKDNNKNLNKNKPVESNQEMGMN